MTTSDNYYRIYLNKVIQLARTIVIKSTDTMEAMNGWVRGFYGTDAVDDGDPTTWKYYKNLSGEYHFTDTPMYVTSMDTLETIPFNKDTLKLHRATARAYSYGTRQYQELVNQYPKQEILIIGILYPVDIQKAIDARDGEILGYPPDLVEANEYNFIVKLQRWIDSFKLRWTNKQYSFSDNLYNTTALGLLYLNLVPAILNIRLEACKTNEAHSYHVRQYLASHGLIDLYLDQLTTKQALFFYRNINYIERNAGQADTFNWLVDHIMTERNLPLASYTMRHDVTKQPDELYPTVTFRRKAENLGYNIDSNDIITLDAIMNKEDIAAPDNAAIKPYVEPKIQSQMENSLSSVLQTKVLESSMLDYTDATPYTMSDTLMSMWLSMAATNMYTTVVGVTNPKTGERIPLTAKEAYCFMWYAYLGSYGIVLDEIPQVYAKRVPLFPIPSTDELMHLVDTSLVPRDVIDFARNAMVDIQPVISTEAFYNQCVAVHTAANTQRNLIAYQEHHERRGYVHNAVSRLYGDNTYSIADPNEHYQEWFADRNILVSEFTQDDLGLIYRSLVQEATGLSLNTTKSVRELQAAMIKMLAQLSSYSVQFLSQINASNILVYDWPAIRVGDEQSSVSDEVLIPNLNVRHQSTKGLAQTGVDYDINAVLPNNLVEAELFETLAYEVPEIISRVPLGDQYYMFLNVASTSVHLHDPLPSNGLGVIPVPGIPDWIAMTPEQQGDFRDVWGNDWNALGAADIPLASVILVRAMNGLDYIPPQ